MKTIRSDLPRLKLVLFCTLAFSLAAHAYMYFSFAPGHDSVLYMIATDDEVTLQISNGRFLQPVYWLVRGRLPAPWLVGMMSMLFLAAGSYLTIAALGIERRLPAALLCGVLSVNLTVTATNAVYIYTADTYLLAMAFACAGVWLWERLPRWGALAAVPCFVCCMGLYQAYIDVAIGLALLLLMRHIMEGERFSALWKRALRYAVSLLAGAALYYVLVKLIQRLAGVAMSTDYNSLNLLLDSDPASLLKLVPQAYFKFAAQLFSPLRSYNTPFIILCRALLMLAGLVLWVRCIRIRHIRGLELLSLLACAALLPLGLNFVYVLAAGETHDLMVYSFCLIYVLPLLPLEQEPPGPASRTVGVCRTVTAGLCACVLLFSIVFANGAYFKRKVVYEASAQYAFSIVEAMEKDPEYQPGITPVAIVGSFSRSYMSRTSSEYFDMYRDMTGVQRNTAVTTYNKFASYCRMLLGHPINVLREGDPQLTEVCYRRSTLLMPVFPKEGFCQMQDGVMVVKLQDVTYNP